MYQEHIIQYAPLILAAYSVVCTLLFVGYASRSGINPAAFQRAHVLWALFTLAVDFCSMYWCVARSLHSGELRSRIFSMLFLGVIVPIYGGFGFVAWIWPVAWQRFSDSRAVAGKWGREKDRQQNRDLLHRFGERLRRFMGGPPPV